MSLLVNELRSSELTTYRTTIMALVNAIIFANENIRDRIRIRNEFLGTENVSYADISSFSVRMDGTCVTFNIITF